MQVDPDILKQVELIICHDHCSDGTMSAMLLQDALPNARVEFCGYGLAHSRLEARPNMLFCDFSPHVDAYRRFIDAGAIILDHHRSAEKIVKAFGDRGIFADESLEPGVSGAVLAYRHVWLPLKQALWARSRGGVAGGVYDSLRAQERAQAENLARLIGIRDTWQTSNSEWVRSCQLAETIRFFGQEAWLTILDPFAADREDMWRQRMEVGARLVEKHAETLLKKVAGAYRFQTSKDVRVVMFQGVSFSSDACELIRTRNEADLVVAFDYVPIEGGQAPLVFSTRAADSSFDCAAFCSAQGGGGHTAAAGFSVRFDPSVGAQDPYTILSERLRSYEASGSTAAAAE
jgi:hypothetical protein